MRSKDLTIFVPQKTRIWKSICSKTLTLLSSPRIIIFKSSWFKIRMSKKLKFSALSMQKESRNTTETLKSIVKTSSLQRQRLHFHLKFNWRKMEFSNSMEVWLLLNLIYKVQNQISLKQKSSWATLLQKVKKKNKSTQLVSKFQQTNNSTVKSV